ncbi:LysE family translocator [Shewanella schlegeliana]|uniref:LysE family translocator n=1 Tax=Shewanella schlegeliana TaxID=190308 RepID=A0ABS1SU62_9GAMM|nr:LysE family translocator [Shewanella schlegeliana]MBL4911860.1 LysE family translocator [Shewanella schlegeliana]MCL1110187.1 LysE family translocator [Shewanella schlegeliana]
MDGIWALMISAAIFCATMTMTPGPNNILLATSGANFGVRRTLPHLVGIRVGQTLLHIAILLGLGGIFEAWPMMHQVLRLASLAYLLFLSYRVITMPVDNELTVIERQPMTIKESALFQWINPKAWLATITLCTAFTASGDSYWFSAIMGVLVFNIVGFPASFAWAILGAAIRNKLNTPTRRKSFNWGMGGVLLVTIPMIIR